MVGGVEVRHGIFDCGNFSSVARYPFGGVQDFASFDIVDEKLPTGAVWHLFDDQPQSFPFRFDALPDGELSAEDAPILPVN